MFNMFDGNQEAKPQEPEVNAEEKTLDEQPEIIPY
jgi:hypothetical protein